MNGTVAEIWRFPVKSLQGERLDSAQVDETGVVGDRGFAIVDVESGKVLSAKRYGQLLDGSARTFADGSVMLTIPEVGDVAATDPRVHDLLTAWVGRPCRLEPRNRVDAARFDMSMEVDGDESTVFEWPCAAGSFVDVAHLHLLTTASVAAGASLYPDGNWDVRRFRPSVLIAVDDAEPSFLEDAWVDGEVGIGTVTAHVDFPTVRCPMPARVQPCGIASDRRIVHTLRDNHDTNLGVYATVTQTGRVSVGDAVDFPT